MRLRKGRMLCEGMILREEHAMRRDMLRQGMMVRERTMLHKVMMLGEDAATRGDDAA